MAKRYMKKNKVKLSREQQRQRAAARMAKKRAEDLAYRAKEASKMAQKRAEDPAYRANEAAKKALKRANPSYRDEENKRNNKRKKTAKKTKRQRKAANPKGYINNETVQLITNWEECEAGSGDLRHRNDKGQHYLGKMTARCGICGAIGFEAELQSKWTDSQGNKVDNFGDLCCCKGKV